MTNEEAIAQFVSLLAWAAAEFDFDKTAEAIQMAIEALEKQIPIKPIYLLRDSENDVYKCTSCNKYIFTDCKPKYCHHCGQAIDWKE